MDIFARARMIALVVPTALMVGALGSEFIGGLFPCEMCHWQRWPHEAAIVLALFSVGIRNHGYGRVLTALAAMAIMTSGMIGAYHAGVEYGFWEGLTQCSSTARGVTLEDIMAAPMIRCDVAQWTLFGVSLAGFNALISIPAGLYVLGLLRNDRVVA